jgi:hypothetical protein
VSTVENLLISGGSITASGSGGAGIGSCSSGDLLNLRILGGSFRIRDGIVGIGSPDLSSLSRLTIGSPHIDCRSIGGYPCLRSSSIVFDGGSVSGVTRASNFLDVETAEFSGSPSMTILYRESSKREQFTGLPIIHIESVTFPSKRIHEVRVRGIGGTNANFERKFRFNPRTDRGFGISVPSVGSYKLSYRSEDEFSEGCLMHDGLCIFYVASENDTFYETAESGDSNAGC